MSAAPETGAAEQGAQDTAGELARLFSDARVGVRDPDSGETVVLTVREFRFEEGLEASAAARPIVAALADLVADGAEPGAEVPDELAFDAVLAAHRAQWLALVARACGREVAWIARLAYRDGRRLNHAMWQANGPFFFEPAVEAVAARGTLASLFRSSASSIPSSAPDTGAATAT